MRKIYMTILLAASTALAQADTGRFARFCNRSEAGRTWRGLTCLAPPLFEFLPVAGAGSTAECACTNPTGAKGEVLTFTRASSAYCTTGNQSTGLTTSSMVLCATDKPRITTAGTTGKKLQVETAVQNMAIKSETFNTWATFAGGVTTTANTTVAPNGATTADTATFTPAATASFLYQEFTTSSAPYTQSFYVIGNAGTSGTIDNGTLDYDVGAYAATACAYNPTTYTRCLRTVTPSAPTFHTAFVIGCIPSGSGSLCTATPNVSLFGAQAELNTTATSYIPTTTVAVTRSQDVAYFNCTSCSPPWPTLAGGSMAATIIIPLGPSPLTTDRGWLSLNDSSSTWRTILANEGTNGDLLHVNGAATALDKTVTLGATHRLAAYWGAAGNGNGLDGAFVTGAGTSETVATPFLGLLTYGVGSFSGKSQSGFIGNVCIDTDPSKCR